MGRVGSSGFRRAPSPQRSLLSALRAKPWVVYAKHTLCGPEQVLDYLGRYVQRLTGVEMILWPGSCVVHEEFKADALAQLRKLHPQAAVLVHPESPQDVVDQADVVGLLDVARVDAQAVNAGLERGERHPVVVVHVGHDGHGRARNDMRQAGRGVGVVARSADTCGHGCSGKDR